jgi:hypothetical protein
MPSERRAPIHVGLAAGLWLELTLAEQLGNIGTELARALRASALGDPQRSRDDLDRLSSSSTSRSPIIAGRPDARGSLGLARSFATFSWGATSTDPRPGRSTPISLASRWPLVAPADCDDRRS